MDDAYAEERSDDEGVRERIARRGTDAIGDLAHALADNPVLSQALATAVGAGERAMNAQRTAMEALNLPSAEDVERLERRLRSLSERVEVLEDRLDDLERGAGAGPGTIST